jgi:hypothetical protein
MRKIFIRKWILFTDTEPKAYILDLSNEDINDNEIAMCIQEQVYGDKIE